VQATAEVYALIPHTFDSCPRVGVEVIEFTQVCDKLTLYLAWLHLTSDDKDFVHRLNLDALVEGSTGVH